MDERKRLYLLRIDTALVITSKELKFIYEINIKRIKYKSLHMQYFNHSSVIGILIQSYTKYLYNFSYIICRSLFRTICKEFANKCSVVYSTNIKYELNVLVSNQSIVSYSREMRFMYCNAI